MPKRSNAHRRYAGDSPIDDPFRFLAQGLAGSEAEMWEEEPVDIVKFIEDKRFLNLKWNGRTGCRPKILDIAVQVTNPKVREAMLLIGKGGGKDFLASLLNLFAIYRCLCMYSPQQFFGLNPTSPIYLINVARNESQAKNVFFKEFTGHLTNCAWFTGKFEDPGMQQVSFRNNICALSGNSQAFGWLGYNTLQWVGDELAFFLEGGKDEDDAAESKAEECWEAAYGSCQTRFKDYYKMIGITTPRFDDDFVMRKFYELKKRMGDDGTAVAVQAATWDVHPNLKIEDFKNGLARDYRRTMRDFGAQPMGVIETFWGDPDFIDNNPCDQCKECPIYKARKDTEPDMWNCFEYEDCRANGYAGDGRLRDWLTPTEDEYFMHFDLSTKHDKTAFALGHVMDWIKVELDPGEKMELIEKVAKRKVAEVEEEELFEDRPIVKVDMIGWVNPADRRERTLVRNGEIYYNGIIKHVVNELLLRKFNIALITADSFQSHQFKQSIEDKGVQVELISLDRTDEIPSQAKKCFVENRVVYPWNCVFAREARHLKYVGKKVDHPTGKGKDIIDAVFGTVYDTEHAASERTEVMYFAQDRDADE